MKSIIPVWHTVPVNPLSHAQVYPSTMSVQVPSFSHGLLTHSLISMMPTKSISFQISKWWITKQSVFHKASCQNSLNYTKQRNTADFVLLSSNAHNEHLLFHFTGIPVAKATMARNMISKCCQSNGFVFHNIWKFNSSHFATVLLRIKFDSTYKSFRLSLKPLSVWRSLQMVLERQRKALVSAVKIYPE